MGIRRHPFVVRVGLQGADAVSHGGQVAHGCADIAEGWRARGTESAGHQLRVIYNVFILCEAGRNTNLDARR
ncbi:hypothetical protein BDD16_001999 [Sphaerotilus montanus]|uniref:Uncharacterized protein n=1 Tax=Sphaerotilus montanus TaxID=522889 RepID=A0A7Y9U5J6_9BURK|nr:hypothetical protein [Sphaerotilus montanus]